MVEWTGEHILTTARLVLRTFRADDLPLYAAMNSDPQVVEYLGGPLSDEQSTAIARWAQQLHAREGIGLLAVERASDGAFIGMCGLHRLQSFPDDVEVAWRLAHAYWGHGYATEAAAAWIEHGVTTLGLQRIISITDPPNVRSMAVMHRLGMIFERETEVEEDGDRFLAVVHAVSGQQWRERDGRQTCSCFADQAWGGPG
jgi:RimJ/RimL family protein N-acetyltransferase